MSKNTRNRILLTAVAALLLVAVAVGGTIAYLQADTKAVVNEFTPSDINVSLTETLQSDGTERGEDKWSAQLIPGVEYAKNPIVTVTANENNVASYLFVKVTGADKAAEYLEDITYFHEKNTKWEPVAGYDGVYCLKLTAEEAQDGVTVELIDGNKVKVLSGLNADKLATANFELSFQAWIIQQAGFESNVAGAYKQAAGITQ